MSSSKLYKFDLICYFKFDYNFRYRNVNAQTLYSEYQGYLNYARIKIAECAMETKHWTYLYDGENPSHTIGNNISIYFFL